MSQKFRAEVVVSDILSGNLVRAHSIADFNGSSGAGGQYLASIDGKSLFTGLSGMNLGQGASVYDSSNLNNLTFKSLTGAGSITVSSNSTNVIISGSAGGGSNTVSNIGLGLGVYSGTQSSDFKLRTVTGVNNLRATLSGDNTIILDTDSGITLDNLHVNTNTFLGGSTVINSLTVSSDMAVSNLIITNSIDSWNTTTMEGPVYSWDTFYGTTGKFLSLISSGLLSGESLKGNRFIDYFGRSGSNDQVLTASGGHPIWKDATAGGTGGGAGTITGAIRSYSYLGDIDFTTTGYGLGANILSGVIGSNIVLKDIVNGLYTNVYADEASISIDLPVPLNYPETATIYALIADRYFYFPSIYGWSGQMDVVDSLGAGSFSVDLDSILVSNGSNGVRYATDLNAFYYFSNTIVVGDLIASGSLYFPNNANYAGLGSIDVIDSYSNHSAYIPDGSFLVSDGSGFGGVRWSSGFYFPTASFDFISGNSITGNLISGTTILTTNLISPKFTDNYNQLGLPGQVLTSSGSNFTQWNYISGKNGISGGGFGLFSGTIGPNSQGINLIFKNIIPTGALVASNFGGTIILSGVSGTASNIGTGYVLLSGLLGSDLKFKTINNAGTVAIITGQNLVTISGILPTVIEAGQGIGVYSGIDANRLTFKTLSGLGSVTITENNDTIFISGSGSAGGGGGGSSVGSNIGVGQGVLSGVIGGNDFRFKSLNGVGSILITSNDDTIIISGTTLTGSGSVGGNGTARHVPMWNTTNNLTNSLIYCSGTSVGIDTTYFDSVNPEELKIDAGVATSVNAVGIYGSINNYLQLNIKNTGFGDTVSSDLIATNNIGSETNYYVDLGINGSGFSTAFVGGQNDGYLYNLGNDFWIGNASSGLSNKMSFFAGGSSSSGTSRMYIDATGVHVLNTLRLADKPIDNQLSRPGSGSGILLYSTTKAGKESLTVNSYNLGEFSVQPSFYSQNICLATVNGNSTGITALGFAVLFSGTLAAKTPTYDSVGRLSTRLGLTSTTVTGSSVAWIGNNAMPFGRSLLRSVFTAIQFVPVAIPPGARFFCGLAASGVAKTSFPNQSPSRIGNLVGVGFDSGDANYSFYWCGQNTGNFSKISTNIPISGNATNINQRTMDNNLYEVRVYCKPTGNAFGIYFSESSGDMYGRTNFRYAQLETNTLVDIPQTGLNLSPILTLCNPQTSGTALACSLDFVRAYMETDF